MLLAQMTAGGAMSNPFAVLTLIAAPAILTNAASVLAMSTSNRFLRASERMRAIGDELRRGAGDGRRTILLAQATRGERQALLLLHALRFIYIALGAFAAASLISIVGAILASLHTATAYRAMVALALLTGVAGVVAIIISSVHLFRATRLSLSNISDEARWLREESGAREQGQARPRQEQAVSRNAPSRGDDVE